MRLIDAIAEAQQVSGRNTTLIMRLAPCTAVAESTVQVNVDGTIVTAAKLQNFFAKIGDQVVVLLQAGAWVAIGAVPLGGTGARPVEAHATLGTAVLLTTTEQTVLSATWDYQPGDVIRAEMTAYCTTTDIGRTLSLFLREDGITIATRRFTSRGSAGQGSGWTVQASRIRSGLFPGNHLYTVVGVMDALTGSVQPDADVSVVLLRGSL